MNSSTATALLVLWSGALLAQDAQDQRLLRLDAGIRARVAVMLDSARARGLPTEPIMDRALEGTRKGVRSEIVLIAASELLRNLGNAKAALGASASEHEIATGAAALKEGVDARTLVELRARRSNEPLFVALTVLTDLASNEVPVDVATEVVLRLAAAGVGDPAMDEFRKHVLRDINLGALPAASATTRAEAAITVRALDGFTTSPGANNTTRPTRIPPLQP